MLGLNSICLASGSSRRAANAGHKQKTINKYTHPPARFPQTSANEPAFEPKSQNPVDGNRRFFPEYENWNESAVSVNRVLRFWSKPFETATRLPKTWDILKSCIRPLGGNGWNHTRPRTTTRTPQATRTKKLASKPPRTHPPPKDIRPQQPTTRSRTHPHNIHQRPKFNAPRNHTFATPRQQQQCTRLGPNARTRNHRADANS